MLTKADLQDISRVVVKPLRKDINKLRKDMILFIDSFDKEHLKLEKRVDRIEGHLDLTSGREI